jgi:hypothetical protein
MLEFNLRQIILVLVVQCIVSFVSFQNVLTMTLNNLLYVLLVFQVEIVQVFVVLCVPLCEVILQLC